MVAERLATMKQGARTDLGQIWPRSKDEAAKMLNVSRGSVGSARLVRRDAAPNVTEAVERGGGPNNMFC